jgi:hypothetical protein
MLTSRIVTLRIAIAALIWASALLAPAAAAPIAQSSDAARNGLAPIERPTHERLSATDLGSPPAEATTYRYVAPDAGPATPGPTDPNAPAS